MMFGKEFNMLISYCESQNFRGWDPYDGLNSKFFRALPLISKSRYCRMAWIQLFKILPVNLRGLFSVEKEYNPKALGLFLSGYCRLYKLEDATLEVLGLSRNRVREKIVFLADEILSSRTKGWSGSCWGYNFDWQARAFSHPKGTPMVVVSAFNGSSLLDAYEILGDERLLVNAVSVGAFILNDLNRTYDSEGNFAFSYSPYDNTQIFNASLLGSRILARIYSYTKEEALLDAAGRSVQFCINNQHENGSWSYGTLPFHQWVDNFHTGYNLECLWEYRRHSGDTSYDENIQKGLDYYLNTFFTPEGISKYYNDSLYPVDIHSPAQLVITLSRFGIFKENRELIDRVLGWTTVNMQDKKGYFYFQKRRYFITKIPYMRWAQAWMFYALSTYMVESEQI